MVKLTLFNERARAPATTIDNLFIGEHRHINRIPIYRRFAAVNEAGLVEIKEQSLFMAIIIRLTRRKFARPINRKAQPLQLRAHRRDIGPCPCARMDILFHCGIFGGHAKGVPPHRMEHRMPRHPLITSEHIAHRIIADMPHMDAPRRIGKHLKDIGFGLSARCQLIWRRRGKHIAAFPGFLPARVSR